LSAPKVSVLLCCYQAAHTLPLAIASLRAQTFCDWECILVDDGSSDDLTHLLQALNPSQFRTFRLAQNHGRGFAHGFALQQAGGEYVCTLDADDWIYAHKLQSQVDYLDSHPDVSVVGTGVALVRDDHTLAGVNLHPTKFGLATAMMRTLEAREVGYDPQFRRSHDFDFFHRLLPGCRHAVLPSVTYAYYYQNGTSARVVREGLSYNLQTFRKRLCWEHMVRAGVCQMKIWVYSLLEKAGLWESYQQLRRPPVPQAEIENFHRAFARVRQFC